MIKTSLQRNNRSKTSYYHVGMYLLEVEKTHVQICQNTYGAEKFKD